jgi:hypothetical protein
VAELLDAILERQSEMKLADLENLHPGETIWVLGSGPSLNFIDPRFFDDKICVAQNDVGNHYGLRQYYTYSNYHTIFGNGNLTLDTPELMAAVLLARDTMKLTHYAEPIPEKIALSFQHNYSPPGSAWNVFENPPPDGQLVYGSSGIHGSIHLAAHLGASAIILVGADCGLIDDTINVANYPEPTEVESFRVWNRHTIMLKQWLKEKYDVNIYSLNPFVNFNLEGHRFNGV